ncbi:helix-turn-helix transcriptional regulator [Paroceanicella profunda]|uniref:Helix-turn-helix transcriptional regulator n=1 Tax=Paroceanicella profunda TaxID=2579971 RepID=A0A5B8FV85_9RHOB|nr:helix-turn-helix domain-containing protein [Paroceanicella profunda]QDL91010.1 helix-turn-helix transcriptional regulator [Paroceanicella profunda]
MFKGQVKAGRTLAGLSQAELCEMADIPLITLRRIEGRPDHAGKVSAEVEAKVRKALEAAGVQFLDAGQVASGPGVAVKPAG